VNKLLSVRQVAEVLGLQESTIRAWIAQRRIGIVRLGRAIRVPVEETNRLIAEGTIPAKGLRNGRQ
jgi:excisionase family DNA binding protein